MENRNHSQNSYKSTRLVFHLIFVFLYIALIACKIAVMNVKDWYKQGDDWLEWKGSLFEIYSSSWDEKSYAWLSNHYCGTNYQYCSSSEDKTCYSPTAACSTFGNLYGGGATFIVFSCLEIIFIVAMIGFSIPAARTGKKFLCPLILFSILSLVAGFLAFVVMAGCAMITFSDACDSTSSNYSSQASSCALTGPKFDLFNLLFIFTLALSFWIFICVVQCSGGKVPQSQNPGVFMTVNVQTHQDQVQQPQQPPTQVFPLAVVGPPQPYDIPVGIPYKNV